MDQLICLQNVSRSYGSFQALRDINLELRPGTIGLVGNNGAGKSTLLKILLGLLLPDGGSGTVLGHDLFRSGNLLRGRIGYMSEAHATVPLLNGVEFVALSGDLYGMPKRESLRRAHDVLSYVGLGELRYRRLEEYSTGNLQRLKLAAALVHDPQLLLLDEPTGGLDPSGRRAMLRLLTDLIAETGKSVILCTHLLSDVQQLCDQVVVLHQGTLLYSGDLEHLGKTLPNRYWLGWHGDRQKYLELLQQQGVQVEPQQEHSGNTLVQVPEGWTTGQFFELARQAEVVLVHLKPDEDDLERLFLRATTSDSLATSLELK